MAVTLNSVVSHARVTTDVGHNGVTKCLWAEQVESITMTIRAFSGPWNLSTHASIGRQLSEATPSSNATAQVLHYNLYRGLQQVHCHQFSTGVQQHGKCHL
jgi:hypothetical protein